MTANRTTAAHAALLAFVFVALAAWSWGRWPDVLIDFGRELYVPLSDRMFQSALTLRMRLVTGRLSPLGLTAVKWPMPCWSGVLPVATVVQMTGLSNGGELRSRP